MVEENEFITAGGVGNGTRPGRDAREVDLVVLALQVVVVLQEGRVTVLADLNHSVVGWLLRVFVHQSAGPGVDHTVAVESGDFAEGTRLDGVATELGEEERDRCIGEGVDQALVAGRLPGRVTAPLVAVETVEVGAGVGIRAAREIGPHGTAGVIVSGGVADGNNTVGVFGDVLFQITLDGTDVGWDGAGRLDIIDDFITGEEPEKIGVAFEGIDDGEDALEVVFVIGGQGVVAVEGFATKGRVDVEGTGRVLEIVTAGQLGGCGAHM